MTTQMLDWRSEIVGMLHEKGISQTQLAEEMGITKQYVCTILALDGRKQAPADMQERMMSAINSICNRRNGSE